MNRNLSGIQFKNLETATPDDMGSIEAHDEIGVVGVMTWRHVGDETRRIQNVHVDKDYRHRGIASEMYSRASAAEGEPIDHSPNRTREGQGWATAVGGGHIPKQRFVA